MKHFDCDVYIDLMPLAKDGAASAATQQALQEHLAICEGCRALYDALPPTPAAPNEDAAARTLAKLRRNFALGLLLVAVIGAAVGLSLNESANLFYNVLILPAVGCAAYFALRKYSLLAPVGMFLLALCWFVVRGWLNAEYAGADGVILWGSLLAGSAMWACLYSAFFVLGVGLGAIFHAAFSTGKRFPKPVRIAAGLAAVALTCGILVFSNSLVGNPLCRAIAESNAIRQLNTTYAHLDVELETVGFNFKTGGYYARVRSDSSIDTHFSIYFDGWGRYHYDTYEDVTSGRNTLGRINEAYFTQVGDVLDAHFGEENVNISYGSINADYELTGSTPEGLPCVDPRALKPDALYDLAELGAQYGEVSFYLCTTDVTVERAAAVLLETRQLLEDAGLNFYAIDFVLMQPRREDGTWNNDGPEVRVEDFLCADIYEEGLADRVQAAHDALMAYYAQQDALNKALSEAADGDWAG